MAAGRPVICLDLGGPATQITAETGMKISGDSSNAVVRNMSQAMMQLAADPVRRKRLGESGRDRIESQYLWEHKGKALNTFYTEVCRNQAK
jgi:glycosyltransferase involved in cell wall biosynthesis